MTKMTIHLFRSNGAKTKRCFKCGQRKKLSHFYTHPEMKDGYLGKCKECNKRDVRLNYRANKSHYQGYEIERQKDPARRARKVQYKQRHDSIHPDRYEARNIVSNAIRDGKLKRKPCRICGEKSEAHHTDYSKPLKVDWLCRKHHRQDHDLERAFDIYLSTSR